MPLGWIDFSKTERNKVLSVLDLLSEAGTLDELGIAPVRDGFADLFFPGTSTIQTRAKYFLIVPYAMKDLEYSKESNPYRMLRALDEIEKECGIRLLQIEKDPIGIIGSRSLNQGKWVKRTPSSIYWAGMRTYGIFTGGNLSLTEYLRAVCAMKNQKATLAKLGNRNDQTDEKEQDDQDAGGLFHMQFWTVPTYCQDWQNNIELRLTAEEAAYLKHQIIISNPDTLMAYILKNNLTTFLHCNTFQEMESLMGQVPEQIRKDYELATSFSDFLYVLRTLYNVILSDGKNEQANAEWTRMQPELSHYADINLEEVIRKLFLTRNLLLCRFLRRTREQMLTGNTEGLKAEIRRRERELKQNRAKTMHPGEFETNTWYGGMQLDYRFSNARAILRDIFESEGLYAESKQ